MKGIPLALMLAIATACSARPTPTADGQAAPVSLTAQIDRTQISTGGSALATFRLENRTSQPLTLEFGSSCQVMPYIVRRSSNEIVHPEGGGWGCATVITELTVPPNGVKVTELRITAGAASGETVSLPRGEYQIYAKLEHRVHKLESNRVTLTVQ